MYYKFRRPNKCENCTGVYHSQTINANRGCDIKIVCEKCVTDRKFYILYTTTLQTVFICVLVGFCSTQLQWDSCINNLYTLEVLIGYAIFFSFFAKYFN